MKLGIIGTGLIVKTLLPIMPELSKIELKAILSSQRSLEKTKELQAEYNIDEVYTDYSELLQHAEVDTIYVALPNHLHYQYTKEALEAGKHVICEKPFTLHLKELEELHQLAKDKKLLLFEAITNQYVGNYQKVKEHLADIGTIHMISSNYSQYSSRYDAFQKGTILPAFDPAAGGGALMDINIYNLHFVIGLFGSPQSVTYYANEQREIDTSGVAILDYDQAKAVCIGSKDTDSASFIHIQGEKGEIIINSPANTLIEGVVQLRDGTKTVIDHNAHEHRMFEEFVRFEQAIAENDLAFAEQQMQHSLAVMAVVEEIKNK
ncbi:NAD(P)-dependent oxidoreductase [Enterococcus florum]|uniref:NAD(P)-dependent oxidoreductase n=1 Tax=Enterococcus florum TaxID=2480627 RepID=A0A4P5PE11_9ENTE|nr:Gfo/Idh/MocA family oxidoreductase [Enterococcus florum]GCF94338.1 NAD(P)-dependent oxidoreductase [Enterococcus florum]